MPGYLGSLGRAVSWPVRRLLDPRFRGLATQIDEKQLQLFDRLDALREEELRLNHEQAAELAATKQAVATGFTDMQVSSWHVRKLLETYLETAAEVSAVFGRSLAEVREAVEATGELLEEVASEMRRSRSPRRVEDIDAATASVLNFAETADGFAAQRSLWFNDPVLVTYREGSLEAGNVNERIAEVPFAFRALAGLPSGARILDVGACESLVSLSLASLGHRVTALDPRGYPFAHPNLAVVTERIENWSSDELYDAIVCVSTIEHVGIAAYGQEGSPGRADIQAMGVLRRLSHAGTRLVLTAPVGRPGSDALQRTYDEAGLAELLTGWDVEERMTLRRISATSWIPAEAAGEGIAMLIAMHPG